MTQAAQALRVGYFGKLPACGDFLRSPSLPALARLLDAWLAEVMERLVAEPRWKLHYDALQPLHFAFVGTRSRRAVAGHLVASSDQSQRRYPFLAMTMLEIAEPAPFLARSPLVLAPLWRELELLVCDVTGAADPHPCLQAVAHAAPAAAPGDAGHGRLYQDFLAGNALEELERLLAHGQARRMILAVGLLLQAARDGQRPDRSLALPLPAAPGQQPLVAAFWLDLACLFLAHDDYELALFVGVVRQRPVLVIGFAGAAPDTLQAIIDPQYAAQQLVTLEQLDWIDPLVAAQPGLHKLSACLEQGRLPLQAALDLFRAAFT
ncbi:type VI secretion system-associated protein TagF [Oxalobacteraceae bacterium A2-2]